MTVHYTDADVTLHHGDCLEVLASMPDCSVDAVITDPPYGIRFMGKAWDGADIEARTRRRDVCPMPSEVGGPRGGYRSSATEAGRYDLSANAAFQQWCTSWAAECLRVLNPGGHLIAFGSPRTGHRLASGIEDAGFEIRDTIAWLYGSGFPKSLDVSKAINKAAGAEREVIGHRRSDSTALNSKSRVDQGHRPPVRDASVSTVTIPSTNDAQQWQGWGTALKPGFEPAVVARKPLSGTVAANVLEHGTGALNIDACRIPTGDKLGGGSTTRGQQMKDGWHRPWMDDPDMVAANAERSRASVARSEALGRWPTNVILEESVATELDRQTGILTSGVMRAGTTRAERDGVIYGRLNGDATTQDTYGDTGGASRFFPVFRYEAKAPSSERPSVDGVSHPTVKPLALMRWLVRLVTPPGGVVLDPFAGSGTTAEACVLEHLRCITIEREAEYLPLIVARLSKPLEVGLDFGSAS